MGRARWSLIAVVVAGCAHHPSPSPGAASYSPFFGPADHVLELLSEKRFDEATEVYGEVQQEDRVPQFHAKAAAILDAEFASTMEADVRALDGEWRAVDENRWRRADAALADARAILERYEKAAFYPREFWSKTYASLEERASIVSAVFTAGTLEAFVSYPHNARPCFFQTYPVGVDIRSLLTDAKVVSALNAYKPSEIAAVYSTCREAIPQPLQHVWSEYTGRALVHSISLSAFGHAPANLAELAAIRAEAAKLRAPIAGPLWFDLEVRPWPRTIEQNRFSNDLPLRSAVRPFDSKAATPTGAYIEVPIGFCNSSATITERREVPSTRVAGIETVANPDYDEAQFAYQQALIDYRAVVDQSNSIAPSTDATARAIQSSFTLAALQQAKNNVDQAMARLRSTPTTIRQRVLGRYSFNVETISARRMCSGVVLLRDNGSDTWRLQVFEVAEQKVFDAARGIDSSDEAGRTAAAKELDPPGALDSWRAGVFPIPLSALVDVAPSARIREFPDRAAAVGWLDEVMKAPARGASPNAAMGIAAFLPSVVVIETSDGFGTGFYVAADIIVTNAHVVGNEPTVRVRGVDGEVMSGRVVAKDVGRDVAAVRVSSSGVPLSLAEEDPPLGAVVFVIGNPAGLEFSVNRGSVSQVRIVPDDVGNRVRRIQHDAPTSPGSSGSPIITADGVVVGLHTYKDRSGYSLNFSLHSAEVAAFLRANGITAGGR